MNREPTAGHRRGLGSDLLVTSVVALLMACTFWAYGATRPVRDQSAEYHWLTVHGIHENARVSELGWQEPSGVAMTVIVKTSSGIDAFVDLEGSKQDVTTIGVTIPVVLDRRESPAVGTGVAPDLVNRSFLPDYAQALSGPVGAALLVLLAALARVRSSRPQRLSERSGVVLGGRRPGFGGARAR